MNTLSEKTKIANTQEQYTSLLGNIDTAKNELEVVLSDIKYAKIQLGELLSNSKIILETAKQTAIDKSDVDKAKEQMANREESLNKKIKEWEQLYSNELEELKLRKEQADEYFLRDETEKLNTLKDLDSKTSTIKQGILALQDEYHGLVAEIEKLNNDLREKSLHIEKVEREQIERLTEIKNKISTAQQEYEELLFKTKKQRDIDSDRLKFMVLKDKELNIKEKELNIVKARFDKLKALGIIKFSTQ